MHRIYYINTCTRTNRIPSRANEGRWRPDATRRRATTTTDARRHHGSSAARVDSLPRHHSFRRDARSSIHVGFIRLDLTGTYDRRTSGLPSPSSEWVTNSDPSEVARAPARKVLHPELGAARITTARAAASTRERRVIMIRSTEDEKPHPRRQDGRARIVPNAVTRASTRHHLCQRVRGLGPHCAHHHRPHPSLMNDLTDC